MSVSNSQRKNRESDRRSGPETHPGILRHGLVGGVVAVLLSFLPLSEVLGGGMAGYLTREGTRSSSAAGGIAGIVAFLPYLTVGLYLAVATGITLPGPEVALARELVVAGAASVAFVYVVGLSVLGSVLGAYLP